MKRIVFALFFIVSFNLLAQEDESVPIQIIETVPVYEGCVGSNSELKDCLNRKIYEHFSKSFIYPKLKKKESISGRYFISFKIDKEGNFILINVKGPDLRDLVLNEIKPRIRIRNLLRKNYVSYLLQYSFFRPQCSKGYICG